MNNSRTSAISVIIGERRHIYYAFVTTAPARFDTPSTLTLYAGTLTDLVLFAQEPYAFDASRASTPTRLVLVDSRELGWQRARCQAHGHRLNPADPDLVGGAALQRWLWQRLQRTGETVGRGRE